MKITLPTGSSLKQYQGTDYENLILIKVAII